MVENFKDFLSRPFAADMSAVHWFLFIGLLIVIIALWRIILGTITEAMT